ncbi:MAG: ATP synthase F1 subunit epsilon [Candidatus Marinimicrobia bacterium]|jgi:F-type H+-transporting ATPase subunit epsilon|nr:ATP synthase F1 subunit epsilon [Candidatus Neomarinimicrobiota bacterium]MBT3947269.1 ATP synthase F1 subunit epsilon [Candidatus Neomarinimicrobiota bacterium]MBT4065274.1 ATP synthase F1 subunit epsilon [Candidatus Neomarinimicrobiota bacterium]MBT4306983.1 ATP synthase F1 subunit epsilon [Candidatus Neomarinimicrobiota bacterium]MBT4453197.1 ATP synthase F1 subunit epsilon [Candidatus Neomarinimicrobiota bacterium]|tara:strand:- start:1230 stop:1625 length:396 start_codon:yes stop_codon:yes gene_type:complete
MSAFTLEIVTPTQILEAEEVSYVRCPGTDGSFGIMASHREAVIGLDVGEIKITQGGKDSFYATSGGFAEITKEKVQLLVETVEKADEIDSGRAEASLTRAKGRVSGTDGSDSKRAETALFRAVNRLRVSKR